MFKLSYVAEILCRVGSDQGGSCSCSASMIMVSLFPDYLGIPEYRMLHVI